MPLPETVELLKGLYWLKLPKRLMPARTHRHSWSQGEEWARGPVWS